MYGKVSSILLYGGVAKRYGVKNSRKNHALPHFWVACLRNQKKLKTGISAGRFVNTYRGFLPGELFLEVVRGFSGVL